MIDSGRASLWLSLDVKKSIRFTLELTQTQKEPYEVSHTVCEGPVSPKKVSPMETPKFQIFRYFSTLCASFKMFCPRFLEKLRFEIFSL